MSLTFALQALLARHESTLAEAEEERRRMAASVASLESEKKQLELSNTKQMEENRDLLEQLEALNESAADSEARVQALTATLESTRKDMERLTHLAGRTSDLESQVLSMEVDQLSLQHRLDTSEESNKSLMQRWRKAEREVEQLKEQMDRLEDEMREERERHVDVMNRMERRLSLQRNLEDGGYKANVTDDQPKTDVVSSFVKDVLQDNSNLQMGIVELREILMSSYDEVEKLRQQLSEHQVIPSEQNKEDHKDSLMDELQGRTKLEVLPELHVHHHYHQPPPSERPVKSKSLGPRKMRRRRAVIMPTLYASSSDSQTPSTAMTSSERSRYVSDAAILAQTSATIPSPLRSAAMQRWSSQSTNVGSDFAPSSMPSSIFDGYESRPMTPASSNPGSPIGHSRKNSNISAATNRNAFASPLVLLKSSAPQTTFTFDQQTTGVIPPQTLRATPSISSIINKSSGESRFAEPAPSSLESRLNTDDFFPKSQLQLRRHASHESLLSISGMDIHTVRHKPSHVFSGQGFVPRNPYSPTADISGSSAILSPTNATSRPSFLRKGRASNDYLESLRSRVSSPTDDQGSLGKRFSGWIWGKGSTSAMAGKSTENLRPKASQSNFIMRTPGVNQSGPIRGLLPPKPTPRNVEPTTIDVDLLKETLEIHE
ncbi:MAG: hypothetical protein MMC33_002992 [Icmadophila ericetorum]|nr:hypothetical protein [Icmadophila ericetorum]